MGPKHSIIKGLLCTKLTIFIPICGVDIFLLLHNKTLCWFNYSIVNTAFCDNWVVCKNCISVMSNFSSAVQSLYNTSHYNKGL